MKSFRYGYLSAILQHQGFLLPIVTAWFFLGAYLLSCENILAATGQRLSIPPAADLDGDGDLDLATANGRSFRVSVLLNNGDGTFATHSMYDAGNECRSIFVADLDGDGDADLATANGSDDDVSVLLNNGDGTFAFHWVYAVGNGSGDVFAADLDGDGDLDLTTANSFSTRNS